MAKKSVFDESAYDDDLDEFMPRVGVGNRAGQSEPAPTRIQPTVAPETPAEPAAPVESNQPVEDQAPRAATKQASRVTKTFDRDGEGNPTAEISADNQAKLRNLNLAEKKKNPAKARTYGQIVLDAIDAGQDELARHWEASGHRRESAGKLVHPPAGYSPAPSPHRSTCQNRLDRTQRHGRKDDRRAASPGVGCAVTQRSC